MRVLIGTAEACPYCGNDDVRETRRSMAGWERVLRVRRYRCQGCWRRLFVLRTGRPERRDQRVYDRW